MNKQIVPWQLMSQLNGMTFAVVNAETAKKALRSWLDSKNIGGKLPIFKILDVNKVVF